MAWDVWVEAASALTVALFTWLLWRVAHRGSVAMFQLREAANEYNRKGIPAILFYLANRGGITSPIDPGRCYLLLGPLGSTWKDPRRWVKFLPRDLQDRFERWARRASFFTELRCRMAGWQQAPVVAHTQDYWHKYRLQSGPHVRLGDDFDPALKAAQSKLYIGEVTDLTMVGSRRALLVVAPLVGRAARMRMGYNALTKEQLKPD